VSHDPHRRVISGGDADRHDAAIPMMNAPVINRVYASYNASPPSQARMRAVE